jgi:hypothetical protein
LFWITAGLLILKLPGNECDDDGTRTIAEHDTEALSWWDRGRNDCSVACWFHSRGIRAYTWIQQLSQCCCNFF